MSQLHLDPAQIERARESARRIAQSPRSHPSAPSPYWRDETPWESNGPPAPSLDLCQCADLEFGLVCSSPSSPCP